jgi:hypothetical protein
MDGNFSLKRVDGSGLADERIFESNYHISPSDIDCFKDEVKKRHNVSVNKPARADGATVSCTDNWTAANSFSEETIKVFEQTGIFVCACRHGIIELFAEMKRSGELYASGSSGCH